VLTKARAVEERRRDNGKERWQRELDAGAEERKRDLKSEGRSCNLLRRYALPFVGAGEAVTMW
jgi:hypothetical protein